MALLFRGKTRCGICGQVIQLNEPVSAFPSIIGNELDPLYIFHDASFHTACFETHPLSPEMLNRCELLAKASSDRVCMVCERQVESPDDFLSTGHFGGLDSGEFTYKKFHRSCLKSWKELDNFRCFLLALQSSGKWKGPGIAWLLKTLDEHAGGEQPQ